MMRNFPLIHKATCLAEMLESSLSSQILRFDSETGSVISGRREPEPQSLTASRMGSLAELCQSCTEVGETVEKSCLEDQIPTLLRTSTEHALDSEGRIVFASTEAIDARVRENSEFVSSREFLNNRRFTNSGDNIRENSREFGNSIDFANSTNFEQDTGSHNRDDHNFDHQIIPEFASADKELRPLLAEEPSLFNLEEALIDILPHSLAEMVTIHVDQEANEGKERSKSNENETTSPSFAPDPVSISDEIPSEGRTILSQQLSQNPTILSNLTALHMDASSISLSRIPQQFWLMPASVMLSYDDVSLSHETSINLTTMDAFYRSNFTDYVTDSLNVSSVARDMARVSTHYDVATISRGIEYVSRDWNVVSVAKLIKVFTIGWNADKA
jgi:hypothetical protein